MQNPVEGGGAILQTHGHKNSPPFFLQSIFPTFPPTSPFISLSIHPFLHPSPSKASSQQSAIEFHYSLVMQHFKGGRTACVCSCGSVYTCNTVLIRDFILLCAGNLIIRRTAVMSPANIYPAVCASSFSFFLIWNVL